MGSALCAGLFCTLPAFFALIHRSAWKDNSRNFTLTEFSEVGLRVALTVSALAPFWASLRTGSRSRSRQRRR